MQVDYLDCYLLHWRGSVPLGETMRALEQLVRDGKIRALGVSNFDVDDLEEAQAALEHERIACNQVLYHLGERTVEEHELPYCREHDIAIVGYTPFGRGDWTDRPGAHALEAIARKHGATPHQVILAFLTREPGTFAIPKASTVAHAEENAAAGDLRLDDEDVAAIDEAFPLRNAVEACRRSSAAELAGAVRAAARACGADAVRIASADADESTRARMRDALARGDLATWSYDETYARAASDPATLLPGARSVVCIAVAYATPPPRERRGHGRVSAYAWSRDYHRRMQSMLREIAARIDELAGAPATRVVCDTAPLAERAFAARAGLGWIGKHTSLIVNGLGSAVFLGEIVTTLELEPDPPLRTSCGACTRCVDVCPTGALRGDYTMDATRCISDLTQRRDAIPRELRPLIGTWVWGCDLCNDACPPSSRAGRAGDASFAPLEPRNGRARPARAAALARCGVQAGARDRDGLARRGGAAPQRGGRARQRARPRRRAGARRGAARRSKRPGARSCRVGARPHRLAAGVRRPARRGRKRARAGRSRGGHGGVGTSATAAALKPQKL